MSNVSQNHIPSATLATHDVERISTGMVGFGLRAIDFLAICGAAAAAYWFWLTDAPALPWPQYALVTLLAAILAINVGQLTGVYKWERLSRIDASLAGTFAAWACTVALLLVVAFIAKVSDQFSRAWFLLSFGLAGGLIGTARVVLYIAISDWKRQGRLNRNVAIFGMGPTCEHLISRLASSPCSDVNVIGYFDDRLSRTPAFCWEVPLLGNLDALIDYLRQNHVDSVIIALPPTADQRISQILERLSVVPVDVQLCTGTIGFRLGVVEVSHLGNVPMLDVVHRPLSGWRHTVKSAEDYILASLLLALITPLMAIIALAIKIDSRGPVFFRQKRYGFNNQLIEVFKFRTMYVEATDANANQLTQKNDPRVTRLGAFLRKTSLDELPQFINVLRGDMSIVGPRPHASQAKAGGILYQDAVKRYAARHRVKPGITGWAQINGWRGETRTVEQIEQRVRHDLTYIDNWSLGLDIKIILKTAFVGFTGTQAY